MVNEKNNYVTIIGMFHKLTAIIEGSSTGFPVKLPEVSFGVPVTGTFIL